MFTSSYNTTLTKGELNYTSINLNDQNMVLIRMERNLDNLKRKKAVSLTNFNLLLSKSSKSGISDPLKKELDQSIIELKKTLNIINFQINTIEQKIHTLRESTRNIFIELLSRKRFLNQIIGKILIGSTKDSGSNSL